MMDVMLEKQNIIRISVFLIVLLVMALWEVKSPKKALTQPKWYRWLNNMGMVVFNGVLLPIVLPFLAISVAFIAQEKQLGLFNILTINAVLTGVLSVILLDLIIYWQHRIFHQVPLLWRLHRVHHADQDIDVTTGSRFHFIEIWLSMLIKMLAIILFGISPIAVLVFEVLLNASAMFNHSNVQIRPRIDKYLRKIIVTPDMHRVHHSIHVNETNSNYGFCLSIWDKWFVSYTAQPKDGHSDMLIGLKSFRHPKEQSLLAMLMQPFRRT
ncbi:sterol desaturase family protein [Vibrio rumoiensis]|uniref:Sterol desaturase n=1 Tax=Vibrio rumoiensis 1S-45 TaxID=1188252 RepID=A0A1E5E6J6_9VIBR|nr:sterol desaturase family protein [Vibrio rumoiensis]OEF30146.1 sterol desaturase [Vibrio rumoiensis 1S-45]